MLETSTVRVRAERRTWRGSLGVHRASQSSYACLSLVLRVVCCCARTSHLFTCCTPVCARWTPHRCMRKCVRNSCVAMVSGAARVPKVWFPVRPKIFLLTSKRQRLIFGRLPRYGVRWWGSSPGRRPKSLSETGKKWRATTPSIHLGVPDSLFVTPGNGGIWQQLGWSTVCVTRTPTAHTLFSCAFCQRACPSLLSQLSFRLQSSRHALTSRTCAAQAQHEALRIVSCPKSSHLLRNVIRHTALEHYTWHVCTPSLTRTASHSSDPLLGELQPCADLRQLERGSLAEPHPSQVMSPTTIISFSPKTSIPLNNRILPNTRIYVSNHYSSINRAWLRPAILRKASRHLLRTRTWTMTRFVLCWLLHCTSRSERQMRNDCKFTNL